MVKAKQKTRGFEPQSLKSTLIERRRLLKDFTRLAIVVSARSWSNHSSYVSMNAKGGTRTHHRARTKPERRRRRQHQARLRQNTLRSLTVAENTGFSRLWKGL